MSFYVGGRIFNSALKMKCSVCSFTFNNKRVFITHLYKHKNERKKFSVQCPWCSAKPAKYYTLISHINRKHNSNCDQVTEVRSIKLHCDVNISQNLEYEKCAAVFRNAHDFANHYAKHCKPFEELQCPCVSAGIDCTVQFTSCKAMLTHVERMHNNCHKGYSVIKKKFKKEVMTEVPNYFENSTSDSAGASTDVNVANLESNDNESASTSTECASSSASSSCIDFESRTENVQNELKKYVSQFLLKMQSINLLPVSTIDSIIEEMYALHERNMNVIWKNLEDELKDVVDDQERNRLKSIIKETDIFEACFGKSGEFKSNFLRMKYYEKVHGFQPPMQKYLYTDLKNKKHFHYYVPPSHHLQQYLKNPKLKNNLLRNNMQESANIGHHYEKVYSDIKDGKLYLDNDYYKNNKEALSIILFQDAFTAACPLGSAANKYKFVATYMTMADFSPECRMNANNIKLVSLVPADDLKEVGREKVYDVIVKDIKNLETNGINIDGHIYKAGLLMIIGDNLGQHEMGGFLQCFNSSVSYVCRFCLMEGKQLQEKSLKEVSAETCRWRTKNHYDEALATLATLAKKEKKKDDSVFGIKEKCLFNQLESFHCCAPALAPCLAHDLLEGICQYDLLIYIRYFINEGYFTLKELNDKIRTFPFIGADVSNKPNIISKGKLKSKKIGGNAVEMWTLVRFMPLLIMLTQKDSKIQKDKVWQLLINLKEILSTATRHSFNIDDICAFNILIKNYITNRIKTFPDELLTAKFHYLLHYPQLIFYFGPLIKVWTLRFEHMHQYLKQCFNRKRNYINPTKTVTIHAQLAEAYFLAAAEIEESTYFEGSITPYFISNLDISSTFVINEYFNDKQSLGISKAVNYSGITYKIGQLLIVDEEIEEEPKMGEIHCILLQRKKNTQENKLYFLLNICHYEKDQNMGVFYACDDHEIKLIKSINEMNHIFPLEKYKNEEKYYFVPK